MISLIKSHLELTIFCIDIINHRVDDSYEHQLGLGLFLAASFGDILKHTWLEQYLLITFVNIRTYQSLIKHKLANCPANITRLETTVPDKFSTGMMLFPCTKHLEWQRQSVPSHTQISVYYLQCTSSLLQNPETLAEVECGPRITLRSSSSQW